MEKVNIYTRPRLWDCVSAGFGGEDVYVRLAQETGGPVLELGSGTGRVISALCEAGFECVGLDLSPEMTAYAASMFPIARFVTGDMTNFDLKTTFRLIFVANNTIQYLHSTEEFLSALDAMRNHSEPGGRVVLSMVNPRPERLEPLATPKEAWRFQNPETGRDIIIMETFEYDPKTQIGTTTWVHHDKGVPVLEYDFTLVYRRADQVADLCEASGFRINHLAGDHEGGSFSETTSRHMVFTLSPL